MTNTIPEGYGFIAGRSAKKARAALDAASSLGLDPQQAVQATSDGYIVPLDVLDLYNREPDRAVPGTESEASQEDAPTSDWKNAEIVEWAQAHDVDLGEATKKADMLAAIQASTEEKE